MGLAIFATADIVLGYLVWNIRNRVIISNSNYIYCMSFYQHYMSSYKTKDWKHHKRKFISWGADVSWPRRGQRDHFQRTGWSRQSACICKEKTINRWHNKCKQCHLLLMENGRLSPGGGRASSPLLATDVEKFLVDWTARLANWANILMDIGLKSQSSILKCKNF